MLKLSSSVEVAAHALREEIFSREPGAFLGSEDELLAKLDVSRPTFRQAARILEHEQLMTIRRGIGGGYFASRPDVATVTRAAALYLHGTYPTFAQIFQVSFSLFHEAVRSAAECRDATLRQRFRKDMRFGGQSYADMDPVTLSRRMHEMTTMISRLSGNSALGLFLDILFELYEHVYLSAIEKIFRSGTDRTAAMGALIVQLSNAIADGDAELATFLSRRIDTVLMEWAKADGVVT